MGERKTYTEIVKHLVDIYPNLKEDKGKFSDFIIAKFVVNFMNDPNIKGEHEEKKNKAKEIYKEFVKAWEDLHDRDHKD